MSNATKTAVALLRVSTDQQAESGLGLEGQHEAIERFAAAQGITIAHWITEPGVSGGAELSDRPSLCDALAIISAESHGYLLVAKHDRLSRNPLTTELVLEQLRRSGASLLSADGQANEATPESELLRRIIGAVSAYERALVSVRTRAAMRAKRARGESLGPKPYGRDEDEAAALGRCWTLHDEGRTGQAIAEALTQEGFTSRQGGPISRSWVSLKLKCKRPVARL